MKEETKIKIREAMLRIGHLPPSQKGIKRTPEQIERASLSRIGHRHSEETCKKMSNSRTGNGNHFYGKTHSEEAKLKMIESKKRLYANGYINPNKKYFTLEEARKAKSGSVKKRELKLKELRKQGLTHTRFEWEKLKIKHENKCLCCRESARRLTRDHIVPLSKGGNDSIENIQPLCQSCNSKKHTKVTQY